jgi:hypothetical protein
MAGHWEAKAREHGYDPKEFRDAKEGEGLSAIVGLKHMKGAVIGDPENCSGSRCLNDMPEIDWTYIGATTGFVAFTDGRLRRFMVNGIPSGQDRTMNIAGEEIRLRPPARTETISFQRKRNRDKPRGGGTDKKGTGTLKARERSFAAVLRNNDTVGAA